MRWKTKIRARTRLPNDDLITALLRMHESEHISSTIQTRKKVLYMQTYADMCVYTRQLSTLRSCLWCYSGNLGGLTIWGKVHCTRKNLACCLQADSCVFRPNIAAYITQKTCEFNTFHMWNVRCERIRFACNFTCEENIRKLNRPVFVCKANSSDGFVVLLEDPAFLFRTGRGGSILKWK